MDKNFKKLATFKISEYTQLCDVSSVREQLKECKPYIVDNAIDAFESTSLHVMTAVEYIDVESGKDFNSVACAGYVWTGVRTADRWWFCYTENVYTGNKSILIVDGNDDEHEYQL